LDDNCGADLSQPTVPGGKYAIACVRYVRSTPGRSEAKLIVTSDVGTAESVLIGGALFDSDDDGVADEEEWGPDRTDQSFDGNGDETPDSEQAHVASLHSHDDGAYVTIAVSEGGEALEEVTANAEPRDLEWEWPWGFYAFHVTGVTGPVVVEMFLHEGGNGRAPVSYVKHGPQVPGSEPSYYAFEYDEGTETGALLEESKAELHFIDGQRGDHDWDENGVIVDPGGPAVEAEPGHGSGGGCSCRVNHRKSLISNVGLGLLVFGLLWARRFRRRD
jgi:MYXO-CTERM domain-containing protein